MKFETKSLCAATALIALTLASGCAGNQPAPAKILAHSAPFMYLQDEDIARNKGNIEGLFNTWIKPRLGSYGTIELPSAKIKTSALAGIQDGMTRFCKESAYQLETLVAEDGIALSVDSTPLASIHILSSAKERLGK